MLALFAVSCDDYLDKNPLDQISSQTFWNSQADAEMALTGIYARLTASTYIYRNGSNMSIMGGDSNQSSASLGAASVG